MQNSFSICLQWLVIFLLASVSPALAQNLALNKSATASSTVNTNSANKAIDGDPATRWESASSDPQSLVIDLGSLQKVDRIRLYWEGAYGKAFTLDVSADNSAWTTVVTEQNNTSTTDDYSHLYSDAVGNVRYVRMVGSARATQFGYSLYEFEVYSSSASNNLALGKVSYVSTSQSGFPKEQAFDDNSNTRWGSEYDTNLTTVALDSNYIYVDLRGMGTITQVALYWENALASDYKIEVSDDAKVWKGVKRISGNTQKTNIITLSASGRYVRMHGLKRATNFGYSLWEFAVSGSLQPLPVTLTSFSAVPQSAGVAVSWATASEQRNAGFQVQRSNNGVNFKTLAFVAGAGTTQSTHTYSYFDATVLSTTGYYRLQQLDTDGTFAYSPVVAVQAAVSTAAISTYPNPTTDRTTVNWQAPITGAGRWYLTNSTGQVVHAEVLSGEATTTLALDLQPYPAGSYVLTVESTGKVLHRTRVQKAN